MAELVPLWDVAVAVRTEREALQQPVRLEVSGCDGQHIQAEVLTGEERHARLTALRRELDQRIAETTADL